MNENGLNANFQEDFSSSSLGISLFHYLSLLSLYKNVRIIVELAAKRFSNEIVILI